MISVAAVEKQEHIFQCCFILCENLPDLVFKEERGGRQVDKQIDRQIDKQRKKKEREGEGVGHFSDLLHWRSSNYNSL